MKNQSRERGTTLLFALGILTLLAVFGVTFVAVTKTERSASANYTQAVRARLLARAGVERALAELQRLAKHRHYSHPVADGWAYSDTLPADNPGAIPVGDRNDLLYTVNPSFPTTEAAIPFFGSPLVHSAEPSGMGSSFNNGIDCYKLKILDVPSMLNLNHPDAASIKRMLKNMLSAAGLAPGTAATIAIDTINNRPGAGFTSKSEMRSALESAGLPPVTDLTAPANWFTIRDMVTCYGWVDEKVIRPWALNSSPSDLDEAADLELARHALDPLPRAPININTAPFEVLVALFAEARGVNERYGSFKIGYQGAVDIANAIVAHRAGAAGPFKTWREFEDFVDGVGPSPCPATAFQAAKHTVSLAPSAANTGAPTEANPGGDLPGHRWRSEIPVEGNSLVTRALNPAGRNQGIRDLVKAVANPNTMLSKFGAPPNSGSRVILTGPAIDTRMPRFIDKSDIVALTTEGCFDAMGMFEITALGLVLQRVENDAGGFDTIVIAAQTEKQVVHVYSVFRLTTQEDFERHRASMISGNFMPAQDLNWSYSIKGANKLAYGPFTHATDPTQNRTEGFQGWPGVLTGPNYSLERLGTNTMWQIADEYVPATYDGNLTLNNLLALKTEPPDFMIGFSRGQLKAFKVRAWWEPRDQANSGSPIDVNRPTHPADDFQATGADPQSGGELDRLATPMNNVAHWPRTNGVVAFDERSVIDELPPGTPETSAPRNLFLEGSSLWNGGVAIHGRRQDPATTRAQFLAYDSANLDLLTGSSVRFWVQPLVDPYLREEEVLLSWVGDDGQHTGIDSSGNPAYTDRNAALNGADARRFGFRVVKKYDPILGEIFLRLEAIGGWATNDGGAPDNRVQFVVTPDTGTVNPLKPEWLPNSWHWVVVNFGPTGLSTPPTRVSLQVDMVLSDPTNSLRVKGDGQGGLIEYGELHGHDWGFGGPFDRGPLRPGASNASSFWTEPRFLGDWFHCDVGLGTTTSSGNATFGPNAVVYNDPPGKYEQGPDWPSTNPFPPGSFNRQMTLMFSDNDTTDGIDPPPPADMTNTAPGNSPPNWNHTFDSTEMGPDAVEGGPEWGISVRASWDTSSVTGAKCNCCEPAADGGVGAAHDSMATGKSGRPTQVGPAGKYSFVQWWGPGKMSPSLSGVPDTGVTAHGFGLHAEGDDCHGCEACDVDGPIFFGGEPGPPVFSPSAPPSGANGNYGGLGGDAAPNGVNPSTQAYAVFDNIAIVNGPVRRTDNLNDPNVHFFEDRYFETTLAFHANALLSEANYGAFYHRGLLELLGQTGELGTLTWTAYPSMEGLEFSVGLWELQDFITGLGATPPNSIWNATNSNILDNAIAGGAGAPTYGAAVVAPPGYSNAYTPNPVGGSAHVAATPPPGGNGLSFATIPRYDGIGDALTEPHLLILGVQLEGVPTGVTAGTAAAGSGGSVVPDTVRTGTTGVRGGVPQPLLSTPVFEDVTLTIILQRPKILFAEEGTEE